MKTQLTVIISLLLGFVLMSSTAYAEHLCPAGTLPVIISGSHEAICAEMDMLKPLENASASRRISDAQSDELESPESVTKIMRSSGAALDFGIGYALVAAFHVRVLAGYHFNVENLNGITFGIYGEFSGLLGWPWALDAAVVPMMHVQGESFRVSIGFGLGMFHNFDIDKTMFEMKPEFRLDWFWSSRFMFGVQISVPIILQKKLAADSLDTHISQKNETHYVTSWMMLGLNFGYKF